MRGIRNEHPRNGQIPGALSITRLRILSFASSPSDQTTELQALVQREVVHITSTLECNLGSHRKRIELGASITEVGGAHLPADVAVEIVEHEPDVAIDIPVQ